jgi:hypothetical protein
MKTLIVTLAMMITTGTAFAGEEKVNVKVLNAFQTEFTSAKEAEWTTGDNYFMVEFLYNEQHLFAYYTPEGDLMGLTRYISTRDLPVILQSKLKANYSEYWVSDLFEVAKNDNTSYYMTLENADSKIVMMSDGGEWKVYRKQKKA